MVKKEVLNGMSRDQKEQCPIFPLPFPYHLPYTFIHPSISHFTAILPPSPTWKLCGGSMSPGLIPTMVVARECGCNACPQGLSTWGHRTMNCSPST
jgi:hypothetical protein